MSEKNYLTYLDLNVESLDINRTQAAQLKRLISCIKPNLSKIQRNLAKAEKFNRHMEELNKNLIEENEAYCNIIDSIIETVPVAVQRETTPEEPTVEVTEPSPVEEEPQASIEVPVEEEPSVDEFFGAPITSSEEDDKVENPFLS